MTDSKSLSLGQNDSDITYKSAWKIRIDLTTVYGACVLDVVLTVSAIAYVQQDHCSMTF